MAYRKTDNTERIINENKARTGLAIRFMLEAIHRKSEPKTPKQYGPLRANIKKSVNGTRGKIHWGQNYAQYQERGYTSGKVRRYTTPGTGPHFARDAVDDVKKDARTYFKRAGVI